MNWKNYKGLVIGGGIILLLFLVGMVLLVVFKGAYNQSQDDLANQVSALNRLQSAPVFPNQENAALLQTSVQEMEAFREKLKETLASADVKPIVLKNPAEFNGLLEGRIRALRQKATKTKVNRPPNKLEELLGEVERAPTSPSLNPGAEPLTPAKSVAAPTVHIPPVFWMDFDVYGAGAPPPEKDIPLLTIQMQTIFTLLDTLVGLGVVSLDEVSRPKFDQLSRSRARGRTPGNDTGFVAGEGAAGHTQVTAGKGEEDPTANLYKYFDYEITFTASEPVVWDALSALVNLPIAANIIYVEVNNTSPSLQPSFPNVTGASGSSSSARSTPIRGAQRSRPGAFTTDSERMFTDPSSAASNRFVAGLEDVRVTAGLRVFRSPTSLIIEEEPPLDGESLDGLEYSE